MDPVWVVVVVVLVPLAEFLPICQAANSPIPMRTTSATTRATLTLLLKPPDARWGNRIVSL